MTKKNKKQGNHEDCDPAQDNGIDKIRPEVERRILRFVNAARVPKDLLRPPQRFRDTSGEHGPRHDAEHAGHQHPKFPMGPEKLDRDLATAIICQRPPFGYSGLKQLLCGRRIRKPRRGMQMMDSTAGSDVIHVGQIEIRFRLQAAQTAGSRDGAILFSSMNIVKGRR